MRSRFATTVLFLLTLFYIIMLGGGTYEQITVTSVVSSAPPKSLSMLQGDYGFNPVRFWVLFRPLTILLFIGAIILNWPSSLRRKLILIAFAFDCCVTLATFLYFAPETGVIMNTEFNSEIASTGLFERMQLWKKLNWIRLLLFYISSILLLLGINQSYASYLK